ncbi:MAG: cobalamin-dependent protein [Magnetococcales bacterium]|nr:cobalamin-dependent protein [Magnetococcales bacterium]MBF0322713.1 cobalamin-dependent protein [Magnetococcales bacterium]
MDAKTETFQPTSLHDPSQADAMPGERPYRPHISRPPLPTLSLINVVMEGDYQFEQEVPIGIGHLASFLRAHDFPVLLHQCFASQGEEQIHLASQLAADVYGFQLNMVNYLNVRDVASRIKARRPEAMVILGGPFLSSLAEQILAAEPLFDCMVYGEGEHTLLEIMQRLALGQREMAPVAGVVWRHADGHIVRNPPRPLIADLDSLPFPARDSLETAARDPNDGGVLGSVRMLTSRGCIAQCTFCSVNFYTRLQKGKVWRGRSPKNVVDELEVLTQKYRARIFNFSDSSFEDPGRKGKQRTREICEDIIRRRLPVSIKVYMRGDSLLEPGDEDLLRLWKRAGVDVVIVGLEAGSEQELAYYGKRATIAQNVATMHMLKRIDLFYVIIGFIMFGPNSTIASLRQNIAFMRELEWTDNPNQVSCTLMLIRDSALYHSLKEEDRLIEAENPWELPRYRFLDPGAERVARHWDGLFGRYPNTLELNHNQVNFENLITRINNPMNAHIKEAVGDRFEALKGEYLALKREFGVTQHDYFVHVLDLVEDGCTDALLKQTGEQFFGDVYASYLARYRRLFESALTLIEGTKLGMSGILFLNFYSHAINKGITRV